MLPTNYLQLIIYFIYILYTLPMNINGYILLLISMLDTIIRAEKKVVYLLHAAGKYCILLML